MLINIQKDKKMNASLEKQKKQTKKFYSWEYVTLPFFPSAYVNHISPDILVLIETFLI